eukprot:tig00000190_g13875.t1
MFTTFSTQKSVVVESKLLGRLHVVFQGIALFYITCQIIYFRQYASPEVPNGQVNTWSLAAEAYMASIPANVPYCSPEALKAYRIPFPGFYDPVCAIAPHDSVHKISANGIFLATGEHADEVRNGTVVGHSDTIFKGAEYLPFSFLHGVSLSWTEQSEIETELLDRKGKVVRYSKTGIVQDITFKEILEMAGVDLEGENAQDPTVSASMGKVLHRSTGVQIVVRLEYGNLYQYLPGFSDIRCRITAQKLPFLWGFQGPSPNVYIRYPDHYWRRSQNGVNVNFIIQGQVHRFSWISVITGVISGIVLIKLADNAIAALARVMYKERYRALVQERTQLAAAAAVVERWRQQLGASAASPAVHPAPASARTPAAEREAPAPSKANLSNGNGSSWAGGGNDAFPPRSRPGRSDAGRTLAEPNPRTEEEDAFVYSFEKEETAGRDPDGAAAPSAAAAAPAPVPAAVRVRASAYAVAGPGGGPEWEGRDVD